MSEKQIPTVKARIIKAESPTQISLEEQAAASDWIEPELPLENLGWEENENEISVWTSFTARNDKTAKGRLSSLIKPGCLIGVFVTTGETTSKEVARGYVTSWNPSLQNNGNRLKCTCYDELYNLQKSQDNLYFSSGIGTQSAINNILDSWEIPMNQYEGPNVIHGTRQYMYFKQIIQNL